MNKTRILIVDDDKDILFILAHSIKRLAPEYDVVTTQDGLDALAEFKKSPFDLVLTDHMMPEMTGLQLTRTIKETWPQTKLILMSAYEASRLNTNPSPFNPDVYITKPFKVPEVIEMVKEMVSSPGQKTTIGSGALPIPAKAQHLLQQLWKDTGANIVLLLNTNGQPLKTVCDDAELTTLAHLATFVADNFLSVTELASLLGDHQSSFSSSYHQGNRFNIYAHNVTDDLLLAIVFGSDKKPGPIWVYTKQTATSLAELLKEN